MEKTMITPSHEALIQKVKGHIAYHGDDGLFEGIASEVVQAMVTDDEDYESVGQNLWNAYLESPAAVDAALIALCGWSMESLISFTGLLSD